MHTHVAALFTRRCEQPHPLNHTGWRRHSTEKSRMSWQSWNMSCSSNPGATTPALCTHAECHSLDVVRSPPLEPWYCRRRSTEKRVEDVLPVLERGLPVQPTRQNASYVHLRSAVHTMKATVLELMSRLHLDLRVGHAPARFDGKAKTMKMCAHQTRRCSDFGLDWIEPQAGIQQDTKETGVDVLGKNVDALVTLSYTYNTVAQQSVPSLGSVAYLNVCVKHRRVSC